MFYFLLAAGVINRVLTALAAELRCIVPSCRGCSWAFLSRFILRFSWFHYVFQFVSVCFSLINCVFQFVSVRRRPGSAPRQPSFSDPSATVKKRLEGEMSTQRAWQVAWPYTTTRAMERHIPGGQ